jgi:hypothetical protein
MTNQKFEENKRIYFNVVITSIGLNWCFGFKLLIRIVEMFPVMSFLSTSF